MYITTGTVTRYFAFYCSSCSKEVIRVSTSRATSTAETYRWVQHMYVVSV